MLLDLIIGFIFLGYLFFNCSLVILSNKAEVPIWKQVVYFLFGVFVDGIGNLRTAFRK